MTLAMLKAARINGCIAVGQPHQDGVYLLLYDVPAETIQLRDVARAWEAA